VRRTAWGLLLGAAMAAGCGRTVPPPPPTPAEEKAAEEELKMTAEQERRDLKAEGSDPDR
jgi:hypothetical protein